MDAELEDVQSNEDTRQRKIAKVGIPACAWRFCAAEDSQP